MSNETIRVLSAASAEESFGQLQQCVHGVGSYGVLVPQAHFLEQLLRFYPDLPRENFYTPSSLLKALGLTPLPIEVACFCEDFNERCDPSLWEDKDSTFDAWLQGQPYASWNSAPKTGKTLFERCIFFGSFRAEQRQAIVSFLSSCCRECVVLQRTFPQKTSEPQPVNLRFHLHPTVASGYAWVERMKTEYPNAYGLLLPSAEPLMTLFRKPPPRACSAWPDWQEQGTVGAFLTYAQTQTDLETLRIWQKDCDSAFRACLTEQFDVIRDKLAEQGKTWAEPFAVCDWPASAPVGTYIALLQNAKPPQTLANMSVLQTCPTTTAKRTFFAWLRRILQYRSGLEDNVLLLEEAAYLPVKNGWIPQAIATDPARDAIVLTQVAEIARRGGSLHLGIPLRDRNGEALQPLLEPVFDTNLPTIQEDDFLSTDTGITADAICSRTASGVPQTDTIAVSQTAETNANGSRTYRTMSNAYAMPVPLSKEAYKKLSKPTVLHFPDCPQNEKIPNTEVLAPQKNDTKSESKNALRIPTELIVFSCKDWERFYLCPQKTRFERILKTVSVPLHSTTSKALFWGESIHDNLHFGQSPRNLDAWKNSIRQRSDARWKTLCRTHPSTSLLRQRHQRALEFSLKMAEACEEFLGNGWDIYSEYVLPPNAAYVGRIDLLAMHDEQQKIVVIDYKSGSNETLAPKTLKSGHGWQLLLYGQALQTLYPTYTVDLRMVLRTGKAITLSLDELHEVLSEMNAWTDAFRQSGVYEPLPDEKAETLPLAFGSGMF